MAPISASRSAARARCAAVRALSMARLERLCATGMAMARPMSRPRAEPMMRAVQLIEADDSEELWTVCGCGVGRRDQRRGVLETRFILRTVISGCSIRTTRVACHPLSP